MDSFEKFEKLDLELTEFGEELSKINPFVTDLKLERHQFLKKLNFEILQWSIKHGFTLPLNVIMLLNTIGGTTSLMCHGAGIKQKTMSDLVVEVEFVNGEGQVQVVNDPTKLKAVAGSFGLFGVILSLSYRFSKMTYATFSPRTTCMSNIIPPYSATINEVRNYDASSLQSLVENNYYNEFFWFPGNGQDQGFWLNAWKNVGDENYVETNLISKTTEDFQVQTSFMFSLSVNVLQSIHEVLPSASDTPLKPLLENIFSKVSSTSAICALPTLKNPKISPLSEALHFQRGIHYTAPQNCMEIQIPVPSFSSDLPDWSVAAKAWWDIIDIYENEKRNDKRNAQSLLFVLEMRIMGDSDILLAPSKGNKHGTVTIEILSTKLIDDQIWEQFMQKLASKILSYKDHNNDLLKSRFHWAKQIPKQFMIDGQQKKADQYHSEIYASEMDEFCQVLDEISPGGRAKAFELFGNKKLEAMFHHQMKDANT